MRLSDEALATIQGQIPAGCYFVLIVAGPDGTGVDTSVPAHLYRPFMQEVMENIVFEDSKPAQGILR